VQLDEIIVGLVQAIQLGRSDQEKRKDWKPPAPWQNLGGISAIA
jgi:hypothetical protein